MKVIAENGAYTLAYKPEAANRYVVYKTTSTSPSGDLKLHTEVAHASIMTKKIKSYFTKQQMLTARANVHAIDYCARKYKVSI